ncbi:hypothetical protein SRHO_G00344290 [Serrasalmus rhombeus]
MKPHRSEPEPERSSSPGSNSDVPPSQLKATSEITPGSADDMCLSSRPLESSAGQLDGHCQLPDAQMFSRATAGPTQ